MKKFKLYDEVKLTEQRSNFIKAFDEGHVFRIVEDAGERGWNLKDKEGEILNDVSEEYLEYSDRHIELQLDYNIGLISNFMDLHEEMTGRKIAQKVFDRFFNV